MLDLHIHLLGHQDRKATLENLRMFLVQAQHKNLKEIGFADHDYYFSEMNLPMIKEVANEFSQLQVRIGIEVDYFPDQEDKIRQMLSRYPFDYVIGSVHQIGEWIFDMPDQEARHLAYAPDQLYRDYFALVTKAAQSGLFTTIGHFDLIKIYGVRPVSDVLNLADEALTTIAEKGLAMEINTNGRYKPVGEVYPEWKIVQNGVKRGIPFTLGSDAHCSAVVGRDIDEALNGLFSAGARSVVGFSCGEQEKFLL